MARPLRCIFVVVVALLLSLCIVVEQFTVLQKIPILSRALDVLEELTA